MKSHPAAEMFPLMTGDDLRELADDIKANGLLEPIVTLDSMILDGRNRYAACGMVAVPPRLVPWDGKPGSPTLYVVAKNLHRRHLTNGQRATIGVEMLPMLHEEGKKRQQQGGLTAGRGRPQQVPVDLPEAIKGEARDIAARALGIGASTISHAKVVKKLNPEGFERLRTGESKVDVEYHKAHKTEPPKRPSTASDKWKSQRHGAHKRRMVDGLSAIEGYCTGLGNVDCELVRAACTEEELKTWAGLARDIASKLRAFGKELDGNGRTQNKEED